MKISYKKMAMGAALVVALALIAIYVLKIPELLEDMAFTHDGMMMMEGEMEPMEGHMESSEGMMK